jgi:ribosomal protein S18 acetylase RimI-like enzyme
MSDRIVIRDAEPADAADIRRLVHGNAAFHGKPELALVTDEMIRRDGFGPQRLFSAVLGFVDGRAVGIAQYTIRYNAWSGTRELYVMNLFIDEPARKLGLGRALMVAAAKRSIELDCAGLSLAVDRSNLALDFYKRLGMEVTDRMVSCRFKSEELAAFIG